MRAFYLGLLGTFFCSSAYAADVPLERHSLGSWEADIGYSGVVRDGNTLHISGVPCKGKDMHEAVRACYGRLTEILRHYGADSSQVVKETAFTTDMEALKKAIPDRKAFFTDGKYPAASWVQVSRLFDSEYMLEVEWTVRLADR
ncbi:RidA family protein [Stenotrophomonas sp. SY1]|uniref:RidA family protein n=1 Tax=Stenotrophomonas sp. SY1 TaxID=477235 RepID=UPI001E3FDF5A|nr:RidA family protein [Stenotrophomonas sp. SY1]MCD9086414.1 RidA family protein [Stenotrophomonas sp. SY1]